ncbi:TatD family hydrolase [Paraglaciecola sp. L3A3]|uniref:TatD family hydrolase n=1 Tax=Paraglaciecola sp. L3A3 TaxID=2686358 RepID=UPI00131C3170|nr:TatD family hydrolase [Paraglaciecola sp. L3A3]
MNQTQPVLIDSHCHLDFSCFDQDRLELIKRCKQLAISQFVIPGTQASGWQKQIELAQQYPSIKFALGLHPYFLADYQNEHLEQLTQLLNTHKNHLVALGEIGLDSAIAVDWQLQTEVFTKQLSLAKSFDLPVILHHRKSHNELLRILKTEQFANGGIIHAFSGSLQQAETYIQLGFKIGVGGSITYPRANKTRQTISQLPLSSLVLETDAPDMPVAGRQGQRNSPEYLVDIVQSLQQIRTESAEQLTAACLHNTLDVLRNITA